MLLGACCSSSSGHRSRSTRPKLHTQLLFGSFHSFVHMAASMKVNRPHTRRWLTCGHGEVLGAACPTSHRLNGGLFCLDCFHSDTKHNKKHTSGQITGSAEYHRCKYLCKEQRVTASWQQSVTAILLFFSPFLPL